MARGDYGFAFKRTSMKQLLSVSVIFWTLSSPVQAQCPGPGCPAILDIVDSASASGNFTTLAAALNAAGLAETLKGDGPFTIFAPTDAAFAALPSGTIEALLNPENKDQLVAILAYHILPGNVRPEDLTEVMVAATVNGASVMITLEGGPRVNGASISEPGIEATNGIIYSIDTVLLPPM